MQNNYEDANIFSCFPMYVFIKKTEARNMIMSQVAKSDRAIQCLGAIYGHRELTVEYEIQTSHG